TGATGPTGLSGFTSTLPSGKTETGAWDLHEPGAGFEEVISISFPIPLPAPSANAHYLNPSEIAEEEGPGFEAGCTGTVANPTAPAGVLCVYAQEQANLSSSFTPFFVFKEEAGYQKSGTLLRIFTETEGSGIDANGSWAVTAP